jgi:hypothetical protein
LKYDGAGWVPSDDLTISGLIVGDLKGSVFGDDSTVLVDGVNGRLNLSRNELADLFDVDTAAPTNDQVLAWNGIRWTPTNLGNIQLTYLTGDVKGSVFADDSTVLVDGINGTLNLSGNNLADLQDVDTTGIQLGDILSWNGFGWAATGGFGEIRVTDIQGSVYGDDSNIIVDSGDNSITTTVLSATDIISGTISTGDIVLESGTTFPSMIITRTNDAAAFYGTSEKLGIIRFQSSSILDTPNIIYSGFITSFVDKLVFGHTLNASPVSAEFMTLSSGNLRIGGQTLPTERLEVVGNAQIDGFVQFGSYTTIERDNLTTTNNPQYANNFGMVIYNVDVDKFQGWANVNGITPTWVDLS